MTTLQVGAEPVTLPALDVLEEIGRGATSVVYRARRGDRDVAVKVQRRDPTGDAAARFRREAAVLALVQHPALPIILEVGEADGAAYLVTEYLHGESLAAVLARGPLSPPEAVRLAKTLGGALGELHRHGLVHRDVKPENALLDDLGEAKLIDFGFAAHAAPPASEQHGRAGVAGTLLYSAPEQTGLLNRPVDGRSDLYALGAVLFECVTGRPPFLAADAGGVLQQHATQRAPAARSLNAAVTPALAAVIAKLLEKDPDDRYQTGAGLVADLEQIEALDAAAAAGQELVLGQRDRAAGAFDELPLMGRSGELARLEEQWQSAVRGRGRAVLVAGAAGTGKSRLVWELLRRVREERATVLAGKCAESDPLPFAPLRAAVEGWLRQLQQLPRSRRAEGEARVTALAGEDVPLLRQLSPRLAAVLPASDAAIDQPPAPHQFHEALAEFLFRLLGDAPYGAALFLDDVQWLDEGSLSVLRLLVPRLDASRLLLVCAQRTVEGGGPARRAAAPRIADVLGGAATRLPIGPLSEGAVLRLVETYLGGQRAQTEIAQQIAQRCEGNALAVGEYLRALLERGVLRPSWGSWEVDYDLLDQVPLPGNLADLVVARVAGLEPETRAVLTAAAALGSRFTLDHLPAICGCTMDAVHAAVASATAAHLIERRSAGTYVFIHDRVQEALLADLDVPARRRLHQRIAEALDRVQAALAPQGLPKCKVQSEWAGTQGSAEAGTEADPTLVYALARHYALGEVERNPARVYRANVAAGDAAAAAYADDDAPYDCPIWAGVMK